MQQRNINGINMASITLTYPAWPWREALHLGPTTGEKKPLSGIKISYRGKACR